MRPKYNCHHFPNISRKFCSSPTLTIHCTAQTDRTLQVDAEPAKAIAAPKAVEEDSDDDSSSSDSDSDEDFDDSDDSENSDSSSEDEEDVSQHLVIPTVRGRSASHPRSRLSSGF